MMLSGMTGLVRSKLGSASISGVNVPSPWWVPMPGMKAKVLRNPAASAAPRVGKSSA